MTVIPPPPETPEIDPVPETIPTPQPPQPTPPSAAEPRAPEATRPETPGAADHRLIDDAR